MLDLAIVGGGPGGLMSAWHLKKKLGDHCRVTIYEASDRLGGKIVTRKFDSAPAMYEAGVAEIYDYSMTGPDPLRELIQHFGLQTIPMDAEQVQIDGELLVKGLNKTALSFLLQAEYSTDQVDTDRVDRGFRVERVVRNLTEPKRTGEINAPFKLGDQILVTYRINTRKKQNYVALEDSLPAGLETVNPNLAMIGKFFEIPESDQPGRELTLSYSELRDRSTLLYFDEFEPGSGAYSVLARATAAGTFRWPATQVVPMYDSRFSGLSPSSICVISGE